MKKQKDPYPHCASCGEELVMVTGAPKIEWACKRCEKLEQAVSFPDWLYKRL